jgi:hypothetical protein
VRQDKLLGQQEERPLQETYSGGERMNESELVIHGYLITYSSVIFAIGYGIYKINKFFGKHEKSKKLKKGIEIKQYKKVKKRDEEIYSLSLKGEMSGGFFLGFGSIDNEMRYYFYKNRQNGKTLDSIPANETILVETDKEKPRLERWVYNVNDDWTIDNSDELLDMRDHYILKVPKNTIKQEFNANP